MPKNEEKIGGKITLKSIGKDLKNVGHKIESGAKKTFTPALGRKIASTLIHQGIPAVSSALGSAGAELLAPELGPVSAFAGSQLGSYAGKKIATQVGNKTGLGLIHHIHHHIVAAARARGRHIGELGKDITEHNVIFPVLHLAQNGLHKTKLGKGFFSKLKKVAGIAWEHLAPVAKTAGKTAAKIGAQALGEAVSQYTGSPEFGKASASFAEQLADTAIDSIKEPKGTSKATQKKDTKKVVRDALQLAEDAVREPSPNQLANPNRKRAGLGIMPMGYGVRPRGHHPHHMMGGMMGGAITPLESQITYVDGRNDFNTPVQLGSPYQYTYSPAMNPYFSNVNQLQGYNPIEKQYLGGSFVPAGSQQTGGAMMIHHIHHNAMGAIARKRVRGGSFQPSG